MIIRLTDKHIPEVVEIHKKNLPSILTYYSEAFITKFYTFQLEENILIGYIENEILHGFILGSLDVPKLYDRFISENKAYFIIETSKAIIFHPKMLLYFFAQILSKKDNDISTVQLVYIAVKKDIKGKGIGKKMLDYFEKVLRAKNLPSYDLEVEIDNDAYNFYKKNNFTTIKTYDNWIEKKYLLRKLL